MKHHPGDWLFVMAGERMVAMTPEAYSEACRLGFGEAPDAWQELRAKGGGMGDYILAALGVLERSGTVRVELRDTIGRGEYRWPVYALTPPAERAAPSQSTPSKRVRRKRHANGVEHPLVLIEGGATD